MDLPETQNSRDARIEELWRKLDPKDRGEIDIHGLRRGLRKIDHPLKNAHEMLQDIVIAMDKNGDKVIQYEEFRTFVEETEKELLSLFHSIDRDHDGRLDRNELQAAFKRAGLAVRSSQLNQFFEEVDKNNNGYIEWNEWRNFLLFLPRNKQTHELQAVLTYYTSTVSVNSEGDTSIREETLEGLGNPPISFINVLFGAIVNIAATPRDRPSLTGITSPTSANTSTTTQEDTSQMYEAHQAHFLEDAYASDSQNASNGPIADMTANSTESGGMKRLLIEILPDPGYFLAGGVAGAVSRTATAPLDRLKVYLIANVGNSKVISASNTVAAVRHLGGPLIAAAKDLWSTGGVRGLFAGNGLNVLKVMPESAIKFGAYEFAKKGAAQWEGHNDPRKISPVSKFIAGGVGGVFSQAIVYPIDTLKFRVQCETVPSSLTGNALIIATFKDMIKKGGWRAPYRGLTMGLVGMFPYSAIDLGTFEFLKTQYSRRYARILGCHEDDALPGSLATGTIGAISGSFGASVVYPINLLRTRLQAQGTKLHPPTYTGIVDVFKKTIKNEGVRGLFKGITPNLLKVVPSVSITYVVYENAKRIMKLR